MNAYVDSLIDFVKNNKDWKEILKKPPYNLKTIKECSWHKNWYMFVYNLFDSDLTNSVVRACRGTVLEISDDEVIPVSVPYTKFFNFQDPNAVGVEDKINWKNALITQKVDGILLKTAKVGDRLYFFTNGSFDLNAPFEDSLVIDEPATKGMTMYGELLEYALKKESPVLVHFDKESGEFYITGDWANKIPVGWTLMFELTSPRNKIICEYEKTKLWWHGIRSSYKEGLVEYNPRKSPITTPYEIPKLYNTSNMEELKALLSTFDGRFDEGVVVVDYLTEMTPRTKIKCDSYLKLKFTKDCSCNSEIIFKSVLADEYDDILAAVPDLKTAIDEMKEQISSLYSWGEKVLNEIQEMNIPSKKEFVFKIREVKPKDLWPFYFKAYSKSNFVESYLKSISSKKHAYNEFKNILEVANAN